MHSKPPSFAFRAHTLRTIRLPDHFGAAIRPDIKARFSILHKRKAHYTQPCKKATNNTPQPKCQRNKP